MQNKVVIVTAPSGGGKSTVISHLLQKFEDLEFSISACTRPKRKGEIDGKDYYFLSQEEFHKRVDSGAFLEWEEVYENQFYGTLKTEMDRLWKLNKVVLFDLDVKGAVGLKNHFADNALALFIKPPSIEILEERLRKRETEDENSIQKRLRRAEYEMSFESEFDEVIFNDDLQTALQQSTTIVESFMDKPL